MKWVFQDVSVVLLVLIALKNLVTALPLRLTREYGPFFADHPEPNVTVLHGMFAFMVGLLMLLLATSLYQRVRMAWILEVVVLSASIVLQAVSHRHLFGAPILVVEFLVLAVLVFSFEDFSRPPDRVTLKWALLAAGASLFLVLLNASVGLYLLKSGFRDLHTVPQALLGSIKLLVFMDQSVLAITSRQGRLYVDSLIAINWICLLSCALLLLKPLTYDYLRDRQDKERVRDLVRRYGQNPMSYLALEDDKRYLFGREVEGVCAYTVVGRVMVCCGDLVCAPEDGFRFLAEVLAFARGNGLGVVMLNITEAFLDLYRAARFGVVKYGEDALFRLSEYRLVGNRVAKVRAAINHATKAGITTHEYCPNSSRDLELEARIREVSQEWLKTRKAPEMSFMLGGLGLDHPLDRRYFYALDAGGALLGFVVFLPYAGGKAWLADVTRRRQAAPQGVLEKLTYEAFQVMKAEGAEWGNLGLSPLYNVAASDQATLSEKLFSYLYNNLNQAYDFKALHHAKEKYAPTHWESRYLACHPKLFTPEFAYAIVKAQNPAGLPELVLSHLKRRKAETT